MRKSLLSQYKQDRLIEHFVAGATASCAARLVGISKNTADYYFLRLRYLIAENMEAEADEIFDGENEVDESYFGGKRKGWRGRGASGKIPVFQRDLLIGATTSTVQRISGTSPISICGNLMVPRKRIPVYF